MLREMGHWMGNCESEINGNPSDNNICCLYYLLTICNFMFPTHGVLILDVRGSVYHSKIHKEK